MMIRKQGYVSVTFFLIASSLAFAAGDNKPKYGSQATRLYRDHEYVRKSAAPDFWALMPYYLPQQSGSACSIASVTMVVNAARAPKDLAASEPLATQDGVLAKVKNEDWTKAVSKGGGGVTLDQLGANVEAALKAYGFGQAKAETVHADARGTTFHQTLHEALLRNEKSAQDFIIVNFLQSEYTGDPEGAVGHIAPVGAYDEKTKRVLIFDPDREWYEPYWVSEETLIKGMATLDRTASKYRGFVYVSVAPRPAQ